MTEPLAVVKVRDLCFRYGANVVLDEVNLDIEQTDFLGLVGPNGGGKTTLVKLMLGLLKPHGGSIEVFGTSPVKARSKIGYVPQYVHFDLDFPATVLELVLMGRLGHVGIGRRYADEDRDFAYGVLEKVGLESLAERDLQALSGGERQRVLISRALACEPKILLLDEPTTSVDNHVEGSFFDLLQQLNEEIPIVLVSHDLGFISSYITRVACLNTRLKVTTVSELHAHDIEELYAAPVKQWSHDCEL